MGWRLIPDGRLTNETVGTFARALADLYQPPIRRLQRGGLRPPRQVRWIWDLEEGHAAASCWVPREEADGLSSLLDATWPRVTREPIDTVAPYPALDQVMGAPFHLAESTVFAFRTTAPTQWLQAALELTRLLRDDERAQIQVVMRPAPPDWAAGPETAYQQLRKTGVWPRRLELSSQAIAETGAYAVASVILQTQALIEEIMTGQAVEPESPRVQRDARLQAFTAATRHKRQGPAMDATIHAWVSSPAADRRPTLWRALAGSVRAMDGDNRWVPDRLRPHQHTRWWTALTDQRPPRLKIAPDYCGIDELVTLMTLPPPALQHEYGIECQPLREEPLMADVPLDAGISIGTQHFRGHASPVVMPLEDWDEACLPRVIIGRMGTGKTKGFGGNWGAQAVAHGYSVIALDVEKGELGDEIAWGAQALGVPDDKVVHLRFGEDPIRLDWPEAQGSPRGANRLANEVLNFFNLHDANAGIETARYIRLAAKTMGLIGGSLADMQRLYQDDEFRAATIGRLDRADLLAGWNTFEALSPGMKGKVLEPVFNRFEMLLGDDYLMECLEAPASTSINFLDWMTGGYAVLIHLPQKILSHEAVDMLADFLMSKIEIAMRARAEADQRPCFLIMDEPHQFQSAAQRWERMVVETRKWRLGLVWLFHDWHQLPMGLQRAIKSAGPHYHLYTSSKATYRDLAEEIEPFTLEDAMATPRHWAINVVQAGGRTLPPFLADMMPPPSMRFPTAGAPH